MDKKTKRALLGSIKKWEKIISGEGTDEGSDNCPLCKMFNNFSLIAVCEGCPISEKTGEPDCQGTPYIKWLKHLDHKHIYENKHKIYCKTCRNLAEKELKFLKSLLPKED